MPETARFHDDETELLVAPAASTGEMLLPPQGFGRNRTPFVLHLTKPPNGIHPTRQHSDPAYAHTHGEHRTEARGVTAVGGEMVVLYANGDPRRAPLGAS